MSWRIVSERRRHRSRVFTLVSRRVELPNGRRTTLDIIDHPGAVAVVPIHEDGSVSLLRQFRLAARGELYEIPAGTREPGERPRTTALRELIEEAGVKARSLRKVAEFYTAPGFCTERIHLFVARGLSPASAERDADEVLRPVRVPYERALRMIRSGAIRDAKSIVGLLMARHGS